MTNLMLEVDEAMRWERLEKFWKGYGNYVVTFILGIVLFTAGMEGYRAWNDRARVRDTEALLNLLEDKSFPENVKTADLEAAGPLKAIALLLAASDLLQDGKATEALDLYVKAAKDKSLSPDIRDLAILMRARLVARDSSQNEDLAQILSPVANNARSPWQPYALMESASFSANRKGDLKKAREDIEKILAIKNLPQSLYAKARALDGIYAQRQGRAEKTAKQEQTQ